MIYYIVLIAFIASLFTSVTSAKIILGSILLFFTVCLLAEIWQRQENLYHKRKRK